ncbi:MAG: hypothetical protein KDC95_20060 [Planctomycetes bacterium]|nr:hypothetical protein [Planctomycetota bacterium]
MSAHSTSLAIRAIAVLLPVSLLFGHASGIISGKRGDPVNLTTAFPSCGNCHNATPDANVRMAIDSATSVAPGAQVAVKASVSGANTTKTDGGFSMEATAGAFVAGTNTRTDTTNTGRAAITHANSSSRSWSFSWTAPTTPGLVEITAVGNCVDGDNRNVGDAWGFYGPSSVVPGTPYRVFVNAPTIRSAGEGCAGTDGFEPVLGMATAPAVNGTFVSEVYNLPPGTAAVTFLGLSNTSYGVIPLPLPLQAFGGGACVLRVSLDISQVAFTSGRGSGNGSARSTWVIPNATNLRGLGLHFQTLTVDLPANALGMTFSNALSTTIQ